MLGVLVTINIKPGFKDRFMPAMLADAEGSVNNEPGCLRFDVLQDTEHSDRIYLMEEYADEAAFQVPYPAASFHQVGANGQGLV